MKIAYIAGRFRGSSEWQIEQNIRAAEAVGMMVAELGIMPLIPHANTRYFHGTLTDEFWLAGTMELLRRCDAVVLVDGWETSSGTKAEIAEAKRLGIPVFRCISDLRAVLVRDRKSAKAEGTT